MAYNGNCQIFLTIAQCQAPAGHEIVTTTPGICNQIKPQIPVLIYFILLTWPVALILQLFYNFK
jgi:hypothetical protein